MEVISNNYMPGDPRLVQQLVNELKSQGIFDQFRKECFADVDTKPAYQNLRQRVEGSVAAFLKEQTWSPDMNKNQVREQLKKNIYESGYLETGVERIVDQVVNPKINTIFLPIVEDVVYKYLGIEKPQKDQEAPKKNVTDLLPKDLEAVSPESVHSVKPDDQKDETDTLNESLNSKPDDDESPPFEPLESGSQLIPIVQEENSMDSELSGISGLQSHESNLASESKSSQMDWSWQDPQLSQNSSESKLSVMTSEEQRIEIQKDFTFLRSMDSDSRVGSNNKTDDDIDKNENSIGSLVIEEEEESTIDSQKQNKVKDEKVSDIADPKLKAAKEDDEKKSKEKKSDDAKRDEKKKTDEKKSKSSSSHRHSSKEDKHRKDKDKDKSSSKYSSKDRENKDKDKNKEELKSSKDKDSKSTKDKDRSDKDKTKEKDKYSSKNREKSDDRKEKHDRDKGKYRKEGDKDKEKSSNKDKSDKQRSEKDRSKERSEKDQSSKSEKSKDKNDKKDKDKKRSSSNANGKNSSNSSSDKKDSSSSSSKKSEKVSKSGDKHKKEDKTSEGSKEKKRDSRKDDHYSSKEKKNHRRSFDRDSNDGNSGKNSSTSEVKVSSSQYNNKDSTGNSFSGSGDSGNSDAREDNACDIPETSETPPAPVEVPRMKYIKPKFALNFEEAKRIMKIRRQLAILERQNQLSLADLNIHNGLETAKTNKEKTENKTEEILAQDDDTQTSSPFRGFEKDEDESKEVVVEEKRKISDLNLQSILMSKESWEALEARLEQEMKKINFTAYESHYDDYDDNEYSAITCSPCSDTSLGMSCVIEEIVPKKVLTQEKEEEKAHEITVEEEQKESVETVNDAMTDDPEVVETVDQINEIAVESEEIIEEIVEYDDMITEVDYIEDTNEENSIKLDAVSNKELSVRLENIEMQDDCLKAKMKRRSRNNHVSLTENAIKTSQSPSETCTHLDKPDVAIIQSVEVLNKLIGKLESDLEYSIKEYQNNILPEVNVAKRGRKRKLNERVDCENNNRLHFGKIQGSTPRGKRYDSEDLYKPRPMITSTRRNKRDKNP